MRSTPIQARCLTFDSHRNAESRSNSCLRRLHEGRQVKAICSTSIACMSAVHRPVRLTFPQTQVREPVVYHLGVDYGVITSIRRAAIEDHFGWMVLEMTGEPAALDEAVQYLTSLGIEVAPVLGDIVEG